MGEFVNRCFAAFEEKNSLKLMVVGRVARWFLFKPEIPILVNFGVP
jgi:hypothetical protein